MCALFSRQSLQLSFCDSPTRSLHSMSSPQAALVEDTPQPESDEVMVGDSAPQKQFNQFLQHETTRVELVDCEGALLRIHVHNSILDKIPYFEAQRARWSSGGKVEATLPENCSHAGAQLLLERLYSKNSWHCLDWLSEGTEVLVGSAFQVDMWGIKDLEAEIAAALNHATLLESHMEVLYQFFSNTEIPAFLSQFAIKKPLSDMSHNDLAAMILSAACNDNEQAWAVAENILRSSKLVGQQRLALLLRLLTSFGSAQDLVKIVQHEEFESQARNGLVYKNLSVLRELKSARGFAWLCELLSAHVEADPHVFEKAWSAYIRMERLFKAGGHFDCCTLTVSTTEVITQQQLKLLEIIAAVVHKPEYPELLQKKDVIKFIWTHAELMPTSVITALTAELQTRFVREMDPLLLLSWTSDGRLNAFSSAARQAAAQTLARNIGELNDGVVGFVGRELA
jgi:hypothetical protein